MKKIYLILFLFISLPVLSKPESNNTPKNDIIKYSKVITVHGMVCAFCANSLEKKFKKEQAVDQIEVDLTTKKVSILFKKEQSIKDAKLKEIVTSAGFKVLEIQSPS
ncbi:MAG: heavy metal-associated domain-containing protein [Bdellovibrionaceae bacterium]|nr:heavy metal-associated domain-containing protein [Pseudobdellovibrionaceae bacterium]